MVRQMSQVYVTGLACGASDVTGLCHRFGMCHGVCASDVRSRNLYRIVKSLCQGQAHF